MIDFCSYNVRGLNSKVQIIKDFISFNKLSLIGLLETRVNKNIAENISSEINRSFCWINNYDDHFGGRIWVGWNPMIWDIHVFAKSAQQITCSVHQKLLNVNFFISFIYGFNTGEQRSCLWSELDVISQQIGSSCWVLNGDFNVCLDVGEKLGGRIRWNNDMEDFKNLTIRLGLSEHNL